MPIDLRIYVLFSYICIYNCILKGFNPLIVLIHELFYFFKKYKLNNLSRFFYGISPEPYL